MLDALKGKLEEHHGVRITGAAEKEAVELSRGI
jgi:ATP-dependent Clp protease ATP-binding subunit ClpA